MAYRYARAFARYRHFLKWGSTVMLGSAATVAGTGMVLNMNGNFEPTLSSPPTVDGLLEKHDGDGSSKPSPSGGGSLDKLTQGEQRFLQFASVTYNNQLFMTPSDFLDSVTQEGPKSRQSRTKLTDVEVNRIAAKAVTAKKGTRRFFRDLDENGLISYTEYLWLLCLLTKPRRGFEIAFSMFDVDGNRRVDKSEFLVIQGLILMLRREGHPSTTDKPISLHNMSNHKGSGNQKAHKQHVPTSRTAIEEAAGHLVESLTNNPPQAQEPVFFGTSLLIHFFGLDGTNSLNHEDFLSFYQSLQDEILELEFMEFSHGRTTITEVDFARLLLRYTHVHPTDYMAFLQRVVDRIPDSKGITFAQFKEFCQFLNNLDDFSVAVKFYTFANRPISQAEFARAVKLSTGKMLTPHVVHTVFQIFDIDGDGRLSHNEFIAVMKDRLNRGSRSHLLRRKPGWAGFKRCVRDEMHSDA